LPTCCFLHEDGAARGNLSGTRAHQRGAAAGGRIFPLRGRANTPCELRKAVAVRFRKKRPQDSVSAFSGI
jgi:hypothetical protein